MVTEGGHRIFWRQSIFRTEAPPIIALLQPLRTVRDKCGPPAGILLWRPCMVLFGESLSGTTVEKLGKGLPPRLDSNLGPFGEQLPVRVLRWTAIHCDCAVFMRLP